jgi:chromosome segregation ATPase
MCRETAMSEQLDELIRLLEAQVAEERQQIERQPNASRSAQKRHQGQLNRLRQRLDALESIRRAEARRGLSSSVEAGLPGGGATAPRRGHPA